MTGLSLAFAILGILIASSLFSATGLGGGVAYVPLLVALGMGMHEAGATSLFVILATSISAAIIYRRHRTQDWRLVLVLEPVSFVLALAGGLTANYVNGLALRVVFAAVLLLASFLMMRPAGKRRTGRRKAWGDWHRSVGGQDYAVRLPWLIPVSAVAGFVAGMIGIAGGVFMMPAMVLLGGVPVRIAVGTSSLMVALTALAGLSGHLATGSFNVLVALPMAAVAFIGGRVGSALSVRLPAAALRLILGVLLLLVAVWMIASAVL